MAENKVILKKGASTNLPAIEAGSLIFATDTGQAYLDVSSTERIKLQDTSKVGLEELTSQINDAKKYSDIFNVNYLYTTSSKSNFVCTPYFSSTKTGQLNPEDIIVPGAILIIKFEQGGNNSSSGKDIFIVGSTSFQLVQPFDCDSGDCIIINIRENKLGVLLGVIPYSNLSTSVTSGLTLENKKLSHNKFLTKGSSSNTYGGDTSDSTVTSQVIDLSSGSATFKIPKISPERLGHISTIEDYTVTFSQISGGDVPEQKVIPVYKVSGAPNTDPFITELVYPETYSIDSNHQLLAIEFEYGNELISPQIKIDNVTYICQNNVPTKSAEPLVLMFLIPNTSENNILYVGTIQPSFEGALSYDNVANKVTHAESLKVGKAGEVYGSNSISYLTPGDNLVIPTIIPDKYGHITSVSNKTINFLSIPFGNLPIYTTLTAEDDPQKVLSFFGGTGMESLEDGNCFFVNYSYDCNPEAGDTTFSFEDIGDVLDVDSVSIKYHMAGTYALYIISGNKANLIFATPQVSNAIITDSFIKPANFDPVLMNDTTNYIQHRYANLQTKISGSNVTLDCNDNSSHISGSQLNFGDEISIDKLSVDKWGHIYDNVSWKAKLPDSKQNSAITDQTSPEFRNIVVVDSSTNLDLLTVPTGTIIFVKP